MMQALHGLDINVAITCLTAALAALAAYLNNRKGRGPKDQP